MAFTSVFRLKMVKYLMLYQNWEFILLKCCPILDLCNLCHLFVLFGRLFFTQRWTFLPIEKMEIMLTYLWRTNKAIAMLSTLFSFCLVMNWTFTISILIPWGIVSLSRDVSRKSCLLATPLFYWNNTLRSVNIIEGALIRYIFYVMQV